MRGQDNTTVINFMRIALLSFLAVFHFVMYFLAMSHLRLMLDRVEISPLVEVSSICVFVVIGLWLPIAFMALGTKR